MSTRLIHRARTRARSFQLPASFVPLAAFACVATFAVLAHAEPPSPIIPSLFAFPGQVLNPASARSAGLGLADHWLGDDPYANPAAANRMEVVLTPELLRVSRQDLRAGNRNYDETPAFIDGAGGAISVPWGRSCFWLYGHQAGLRLEDNAFEVGPSGSIPAVITSHSEMREVHAGLAASRPVGLVRLGLGVEWTRRQDLYESTEQSGSPEAGSRHVDFDGGGVGGQAGVRYASGDSTLGAFVLGAGVRFVPSLTLDGTQQLSLVLGDSSATVSVERESGWEGGVTGQFWLSPDFQVLASVGGRTAQEWHEFGVTAGPGFEWRVGGEYHDALDPWTFRFGLGQEQQTGVPEPRAGSFALGFGWSLEGTIIDLGAMRRTIERANKPHSFDDRVLLSVRVSF
jgi:hypothetical protein